MEVLVSDYRIYNDQICLPKCPFLIIRYCEKYDKQLVKTNYYIIRCNECINDKKGE